MTYCLDRVPAVVAKKPELKNVEPFKTVMSGDREAMAKFTMKDLEMILAATLTGMPVEEFDAEVKKWVETARDPRWKRPYTELVYQPMLEVLNYLRDNGGRWLQHVTELRLVHRSRKRTVRMRRIYRTGRLVCDAANSDLELLSSDRFASRLRLQ